jgi:two-component sensor histidine kinase
VHHRVANSLQVIASVLMQSVRTTQAALLRTMPADRGLRVMSVDALQEQLAASKVGDVAIGPYHSDLCQSIAASMIRADAHITLEVRADESASSPDMSISLGLIVTELVINALKHAFSPPRGGEIVVDYASRDGEWRLSVRDDGVGMASSGEAPKAGLGTSIVAALANQLRASVVVADGHPGTEVSVRHAADVAVASLAPA